MWGSADAISGVVADVIHVELRSVAIAVGAPSPSTTGSHGEDGPRWRASRSRDARIAFARPRAAGQRTSTSELTDLDALPAPSSPRRVVDVPSSSQTLSSFRSYIVNAFGLTARAVTSMTGPPRQIPRNKGGDETNPT